MAGIAAVGDISQRGPDRGQDEFGWSLRLDGRLGFRGNSIFLGLNGRSLAVTKQETEGEQGGGQAQGTWRRFVLFPWVRRMKKV